MQFQVAVNIFRLDGGIRARVAFVNLDAPRRRRSAPNPRCPVSHANPVRMLTIAAIAFSALPAAALTSTEASAKSCAELRALCWTMRDDKSDCAKPYKRCLATGTFVTPLGRVFKATR